MAIHPIRAAPPHGVVLQAAPIHRELRLLLQECQRLNLMDIKSQQIRAWAESFEVTTTAEEFRGNPHLLELKSQYLPMLQGHLTDALFPNVPLQEDAEIGNDGFSYDPRTLYLYRRRAPEALQDRSPLRPEDPDLPFPFRSTPHPLIRKALECLARLGAARFDSEALQQAYEQERAIEAAEREEEKEDPLLLPLLEDLAVEQRDLDLELDARQAAIAADWDQEMNALVAGGEAQLAAAEVAHAQDQADHAAVQDRAVILARAFEEAQVAVLNRREERVHLLNNDLRQEELMAENLRRFGAGIAPRVQAAIAPVVAGIERYAQLVAQDAVVHRQEIQMLRQEILERAAPIAELVRGAQDAAQRAQKIEQEQLAIKHLHKTTQQGIEETRARLAEMQRIEDEKRDQGGGLLRLVRHGTHCYYLRTCSRIGTILPCGSYGGDGLWIRPSRDGLQYDRWRQKKNG